MTWKAEIRILSCGKSISFPESPTQGKLCDNGIFIIRKRGNLVLVGTPQSKTEVKMPFLALPSIMYRKVITFVKLNAFWQSCVALRARYNHSKRMRKFAKSNGKFPKGKILEANWYIVLRFQIYWKWWNHESSDSGKRSFTHFSRLSLKCINKITLYISWSRKANKMHNALYLWVDSGSKALLPLRVGFHLFILRYFIA